MSQSRLRIGDGGAASATTANNLFWLFFIVSVVNMDLQLAGIAFIIGRIWDAVNAPWWARSATASAVAGDDAVPSGR